MKGRIKALQRLAKAHPELFWVCSDCGIVMPYYWHTHNCDTFKAITALNDSEFDIATLLALDLKFLAFKLKEYRKSRRKGA